MAAQIRVAEAKTAYFDHTPDSFHKTGDVWRGLPTFGLLGRPSTSGVIITPACDLAWCKSPTLTFLPIRTFGDCIQDGVFYPELRNSMCAAAETIGAADIRRRLEPRTLPTPQDISEMLGALSGGKLQPNSKQERAAVRLTSGLNLLSKIRVGDANHPLSGSNLKEVFTETEWRRFADSLVRNAARPDLHFLPGDGHKGEPWCAIPSHAFVLLRYPLSIPYEALELANACAEEFWSDAVRSAQFPLSMQHALMHERPLKCLRVRPAFLHDLLARFVNLYGRIGSPDFTEHAVASLAQDLEAKE